MTGNLSNDIKEYSRAFFAATEPVEASTVESDGGPVRIERLQVVRAESPRKGWLVGVAAAAIALVAIGGVALGSRSGQVDEAAAGAAPSQLAAASALDACPWTSTTIAPDGLVLPCPEPQTDEERALAAAYRLLGEEGFAGMWLEDEGTAIVVAYVGVEPDINDLPGVDKLVERERSLRELSLEAEQLNETNDDPSFFWRVNVLDGSVEREGIGERVEEADCIEASDQLNSGELIWDDLTVEQQNDLSIRCGISWN